MSDTDQGEQQDKKSPVFTGRDSIARAMMLQQNARPLTQSIMQGPDGPPMGPQEIPQPSMTPDQERQIFGPMSEEEQWGTQFKQQVPPSQPGPTVLRPENRGYRGSGADTIERMPQVMGQGIQSERMPNYAIQTGELPRQTFGSQDYPVQPDPSFEGQWSGDVPMDFQI